MGSGTLAKWISGKLAADAAARGLGPLPGCLRVTGLLKVVARKQWAPLESSPEILSRERASRVHMLVPPPPPSLFALTLRWVAPLNQHSSCCVV